MTNRERWQLAGLSAALMGLLTLPGCGNTNGLNPGLVGFLQQNGGGNNSSSGGGGGGGGAINNLSAPFLLVANQTTLAEFNIQTAAGTVNGQATQAGQLIPVAFGINGANTVQVGQTPDSVVSLDLGGGLSAVYVGTDQGILGFQTTNDGTTQEGGNLQPLLVNGAQVAQGLGARVTSMTLVPNGVAGVFLYAVTNANGTGQVQGFNIGADGSLTPIATAINNTGINNPVQIVPLSNGAGNFLYVLNSANNTVAVFTVGADGSLTPLLFNGALNTTTNGIDVPTSETIASANGTDVLLIANNGNNTVTALPITATGVTAGAPSLTATTITGVAQPTAIAALKGTDVFEETGLNNGASELAGFTVTVNGAVVTLTPALTTTVGVNQPQSVTLLDNGTNALAYVVNLGNNTVSSYSVDSVTGDPTPLSVQTGGTNAINTGITVPASNPEDVNIVLGNGAFSGTP